MRSRHAAQQLLDRLAVSASVACMLHCLVTPLLLVVLPVLSSSVLPGEALHRALVLVVVPMSLVALYLGCRRHRDRAVLALGGLGLVLLVGVAVVGEELLGEGGERIGTLLGGAALAAGHLRNYRLCRTDRCES